MENKLKRTDEVSELSFKVVTTFLFEEVAFVLLPIGIIALITALMAGPKRESLLLLREWGFATVVIVASALNRFVTLKAIVQRDSSSRIVAGTRMLVLLLIVAVLCLALSVIRENGISVNEQALVGIQMGTLALGLLFLFGGIYAEAQFEIQSRELGGDISQRHLRRYISRHLEEMNSRLLTLLRAFGGRVPSAGDRVPLPLAVITPDLKYRLTQVDERCQLLRGVWGDTSEARAGGAVEGGDVPRQSGKTDA